MNENDLDFFFEHDDNHQYDENKSVSNLKKRPPSFDKATSESDQLPLKRRVCLTRRNDAFNNKQDQEGIPELQATKTTQAEVEQVRTIERHVTPPPTATAESFFIGNAKAAPSRTKASSRLIMDRWSITPECPQVKQDKSGLSFPSSEFFDIHSLLSDNIYKKNRSYVQLSLEPDCGSLQAYKYAPTSSNFQLPSSFQKRRLSNLSYPSSYSLVKIEAEDSQNLQKFKNNSESIDLSITLKPSTNVFINSTLWVSTYKPQRYLDLLTDETFNRTLLRWLKNFNGNFSGASEKQPPAIVKSDGDSIKDNNKNTSLLIQKPTKPAVEFFKPSEVSEQVPVILIHGPPGAGKTTSIQVIAQHAGYNVIEVNASDDRTKGKLNLNLQKTFCPNTDKIESMLRYVSGFDTGMMHTTFVASSRSVHNKTTNRPCLLLLDEIEGCDQLAIQAIVKMIDMQDRHMRPLIKRPVICCCNDIYDRSLRVLRQKVKVLAVGPIAEGKLIQRLTQICEKEKIQVDMDFIPRLVGLSDGDMRTALNALQLISKSSPSLGRPHFVGDDINTLWNSMFRDKEINELQLLQSVLYTNQFSASASTYKRRMEDEKVLSPMQTFQLPLERYTIDFESTLLTLQDNLLKISFYDPYCYKLAGFYDLLACCDKLRNRTSSISTIYLLLCILTFTRLFCASEDKNAARPDLKSLSPFPLSLAYRSQVVNQKRIRIRQCLLDSSIPQLRNNFEQSWFPVDLVFFIVLMASPAILFGSLENKQWKQYHGLHMRPSNKEDISCACRHFLFLVAGEPFEGSYLTEPLNRFHHMMEILIGYGFTFSKSNDAQFTLKQRKPWDVNIGYRQMQQQRRFNNNDLLGSQYFSLDPPLHLYLERLIVGFFKSFTYSVKTTPFSLHKAEECDKSQQSLGVVFWNSEISFDALNRKFDGYDYINLQMTRVHGEMMKQEIETLIIKGPPEKLDENYAGPLTNASLENGIASNSGTSRSERIAQCLKFALPPCEILNHIRYQQHHRNIYESEVWRQEDKNANYNKRMDSKYPNKENDRVNGHFLIHYRRLFDAALKSHKHFIFKYESGDAKAVRFNPSIMDLFDPAIVN